MCKPIELAEKICRALEEKELWGIHKDAEQLKLMLKELGTDEIRPIVPTPMDSDALEHPGEIQNS